MIYFVPPGEKPGAFLGIVWNSAWNYEIADHILYAPPSYSIRAFQTFFPVHFSIWQARPLIHFTRRRGSPTIRRPVFRPSECAHQPWRPG